MSVKMLTDKKSLHHNAPTNVVKYKCPKGQKAGAADPPFFVSVLRFLQTDTNQRGGGVLPLNIAGVALHYVRGVVTAHFGGIIVNGQPFPSIERAKRENSTDEPGGVSAV